MGKMALPCLCPVVRNGSGAVLGVTLTITASAAQAHATWANVGPVPAWAKADCCSQAHAHQIPNSAAHVQAKGYPIDGYHWTVPFKQALPSPDGSTWLFYTTHMDGTQDARLSFFAGESGA